MRKTFSAFALLSALILAGVTAAQGPTQVGVTLTEFKVSMTSTSIPAGVPVKFTATNNAQMMHEVVLEKAGAVDQPFEMNGAETEIEDIAPGQSKSATWTITQPGEYQLACHLPGHYEAGMVERFTVVAAAYGGQTGAPMQLAAPSEENQAEHANGAGAGSMDKAQATPATLPLTGSASAPMSWWVVAAGAGALAAIGLLAVTVSQSRTQK